MPEEHKCEYHEGMMVRLARGESRFSSIESGIAEVLVVINEVKAEQKRFNDRMFVDNGTPCVQTRLVRMEAIVGNHQKLLWVISVAIIGSLVRFAYVLLVT